MLLAISTAAQSFSTFNTAWNPGANTARSSFSGTAPTQGPGGATWSIIGSGVSDASGFDSHGGASTTSLAALNPGINISSVINDAFDVWASVSDFTNLGQVDDSGVGFGASESGSTSFGDIRIGAINFDGPGNILAHGFQPGTEAIFTNGSLAGDIHIDNSENWISSFDLATVLLHEIGHALGLGHSDDVNSVMFAAYSGIRLALASDDIAGIQSIYGGSTTPPAAVPLPAAPLLFLSTIGLIGLVRRKRATKLL